MKHKFGKDIKDFNYNLNRENNDDKTGLLKFSQCDEKYPLQELQKDELKAFISFAKLFESLPWRTIKTYKGLKFENIPEIEKPDNIEKDMYKPVLKLFIVASIMAVIFCGILFYFNPKTALIGLVLAFIFLCPIIFKLFSVRSDKNIKYKNKEEKE